MTHTASWPLSTTASWTLCLVALIAVLAFRIWKGGPRAAIGTVVLCTLLVPVWLVWEVQGHPVNIRVIVTLLALGAYDIHPKATFRTKLTWADFALLALIFIHILSDWRDGGVDGFVPLRAYCEWAMPYLAGRLALQCVDDVRRLLPVAIFVGIALSVISIDEALTEVNPVEWAFGDRPVEMAPRDMSRWDMKRAYGPTMHAIFFGIIQLLLFPWTIYAAHRAQRGAGPMWWIGTPFLSAAGIVCTGSRGPVLGMAVLGFSVLFVMFKAQRKLMLGVAGAAVLVLIFNGPTVLRLVESWGDEEGNQGRNVVTIDEKVVRLSSASTRVHLFDVYGLGMRKAGWLGWGTRRTTGFPVDVPVGLKYVENRERVPWIDNEYILMVLRFGYLGCLFLVLTGAAFVLNFYRLAREPGAQGAMFFGAMGGAVLATLLLLFTVWMPYDFGFLLLWCGGASSGLRSNLRDPFEPQGPQNQPNRTSSPAVPRREHRRLRG